jgi:hypothetical protein
LPGYIQNLVNKIVGFRDSKCNYAPPAISTLI